MTNMASMVDLDGDENAHFGIGRRPDLDGTSITDAKLGANQYNTIQPKGTTAKDFGDEVICRICLSEEEDDNPIISPCKCIGSVRYIHLSCIQEWLEGKKHKKETPFVNSYIWRGLECEICKAAYNDVVKLPKSGKQVSLLKYEIHPDAERYMVIESVTNSSSKTIHVVNFSAQNEVKVGRGSQCEVRITDVSVSRHHSTFELIEHTDKKGDTKIYLTVTDEMSKFGTLVFIRKPIPIKKNQKLSI